MSRLRLLPLDDRTTPTTLPAGFGESLVTAGLTAPTALAQAPDGRLFVTEQGGAVRVVTAAGELLPTPFASLAVDARGERGLLGIAFDPGFSQNGFVYLYHTVPAADGAAPFNRITRLTATGDTGANPTTLIDFDPLSSATNHNGGALAFGPDGKLYVAVGENANPANAQSLGTRHGKILRYNPDGTIPADNPFFATATGANRAIYALGLRNPFTFAFQPGSARLYVNDVGQNAREEVNDGGPGRNYGWPATEGDFDQSEFPGFTRPLLAYAHGNGPGQGFAIAGAAFYNPAAPTFPADYAGVYFYGDFTARFIRRYDPATGQDQAFATDLTGGGLVDLDVTPSGDLLFLTRGDGAVHRIRATDAPQISTPPANRTTAPEEPVTFAVVASGTGPLSYRWQRDGRDIPGATAASYTLANPTLADTGAAFRVVVSSPNGTAISSAATLTVTTDRAPVPAIAAPAAGTLVSGGQTVQFGGSATDPEDGPLPASALTWRVDYFTGSAPARPLVPDTPGVASGSFTVPTITPYTAADVFFRVSLTARDSAGNTATVTRDLPPVTAAVTVTSNVPVVRLAVDGQPVTAPHTFVGVAGIERELFAPLSQTIGGLLYKFVGWSDGVADQRRVVSTPAAATTFTAGYLRTDDAVVPPPSSVPLVAVGTGPGDGTATLIDPATGTATLTAEPFGSGFRGGVRVAAADVTGDGVTDLIAGAGPGGGPRITVIDGATGRPVRDLFAFEDTFTGGVFVAAADVDRDGFADLVVSPDVGGGPRVKVVSGRTGDVLADFFGIDDAAFRGGVRAGAGDIDGDGFADVVAAAGAGGGPRVAVWSGRTLRPGVAPARLADDFFAFEKSLRDGAFAAAGDATGDGRADLVVGAGPGGSPRVVVFAAGDMLSNRPAPITSFFAGDADGRGGVPVASRDIDADGKAEVLAGAAPGSPPRVTVFAVAEVTAAVVRDFPAFDEVFPGGVFVG